MIMRRRRESCIIGASAIAMLLHPVARTFRLHLVCPGHLLL